VTGPENIRALFRQPDINRLGLCRASPVREPSNLLIAPFRIVTGAHADAYLGAIAQMNTLGPAITRPRAFSFGIVLPQNEQVISFIDVTLLDNKPRADPHFIDHADISDRQSVWRG
jgi:hypothetical protein